MHMLKEQMQGLGFKDGEVKAFTFLLENPGSNIGHIAKSTRTSRTSLYGYLKNLSAKGFVIQSIKNGIKVFSVAPQEKIEIIFESKKKEIDTTLKTVKSLFANTKGKKVDEIKFQIFEGQEEIKHIPRDLLLYRDIKAKSYWPIKPMLESLGKDFFKEFNKERALRNIYIDAIWPERHRVSMDEYPFMGAGGQFSREIRIAPKEIDFKMGYWIYGNKVSFVSSRKDSFGFIIENQEFADMMSSQFDTVWRISKTIKVSDQESAKLYKKMLSE